MSTETSDDAVVEDQDAAGAAHAGADPAELEIDLDAPTEHQVAGGAGRGLSLLLVIGGAIGFVASFVLMLERIELFKDPNYVPTCSFNPVLSCGSVMETWQAQVFGFPNPLVGIASFAALTAVGLALLTGAVVPRWYWLGTQAGTLFGIGFVTWLTYQSLYAIEALCPYCMVVWAVTIPIFIWVTVHNVQAGHIPARTGVRNALVRNKAPILLVWYAAVAVLILVKFWEYWASLV
ncbi:MAG: vitamin K epoxide reductase family protein [Actinomycetota bacterium]